MNLNKYLIREIIKDHESVVLVGLYGPVVFFGIFGNDILAIIIMTKQPLRNVTNLFLCSVARSGR